MNDQEAFLAHIASCPWDDEIPRLIYADWLEEHDMLEEALRQRQYVPAERWLRDFARQCGDTFPNYGINDIDNFNSAEEITYEMVVQAGRDFIDNGNYFIQIGRKTAQNLMSNEKISGAYWKNWEIVTGIKVTDDDRDSVVFFCTC